jgi:hypothetical protein
MQRSSLAICLGLVAVTLAAITDSAVAVPQGVGPSVLSPQACQPCPPPPVPIPVDIGLALVGTVFDPQAPVIPPDTMGAIGNGRIVELNNQQFEVRKKTTGGVIF